MDENIHSLNDEYIKNQALIENTAQDIYNYIREIENKRNIYEKRWIWELLQNALDSARDNQLVNVKIEISQDLNTLIFSHNGKPFNLKEIAHLIFHGSTKKNEEIGKFGTGFLTTHLLSKIVIVEGIREDGKKFKFELNRDANSPDELKELIEKTWESYKVSLQENNSGVSHNTKYIYQLNDTSRNTAYNGINELKKVAPYILGFNERLETISINENGTEITFKVIEKIKEEEPYIKIKVEVTESGKDFYYYKLLTMKEDDIEIAVCGKIYDNEIFHIEDFEKTPKIFVAFPLWDTCDLPLFAIINSRKLIPTEKRDGIFLGVEETEDNKQNKEVLKIAYDKIVELISKLSSGNWENIHKLLKVNKTPQKDWLDEDWYKELLNQHIDKIKKLKILKTENNNFIELNNSLIPILENLNRETLNILWNLSNSFLDFKNKIPRNDIAFDWAEILTSWKSLQIDDLLDIQITIESIANEIENSKNLECFKTKINFEIDEFEIINKYYLLLLSTNNLQIIERRNIFPDQNGFFNNKAYLFRDNNIDDNLKSISKNLEINIYSNLLNTKVDEKIQALFNNKNQEEVLDQIINRIKQTEYKNQKYLETNVELFGWLLHNNKLDLLEGYPLLTENNEKFVNLGNSEILSPVELWNEKARAYSELFPDDHIISKNYFNKVPEIEYWNKLWERGWIYIDPIYEKEENISTEELEYYLDTGENLNENSHNIKAKINKIAFLTFNDKGIIDTIRNSKEKAIKFLKFIFEYVLEHDNNWKNTIEVGCECGQKHKMYPFELINVLKKRKWIPNPNNKPLNANHLASIIKKDEQLIRICMTEKAKLFLNILNISITDLMMQIVFDENQKIKNEIDNAMGVLICSFYRNPVEVLKFVQIIQSDSELLFREINKKLEKKEYIQRNIEIGNFVENSIRDFLEQEGFHIKKIVVGSDFIVEHDFIENDMENILEIKKEGKFDFYIEVKSTTQEFVRMTLRQAVEASNKKDRYSLCVVNLNNIEINEENIKNRAKFVTNIGEKIKDKITKVEEFKTKKSTISESGDIEIEINEGPILFKINKKIWENGITFEQYINELKSK